jgi:serine/threonine protein kinase
MNETVPQKEPRPEETVDCHPQDSLDAANAETTSFVGADPQKPIDKRKSLHGISTGEWDSYELLEEIGHGGMGVVFQARQKRLGRIVAIKVIRTDHAPQQAELERFEREIMVAARLDHPGIVAVYDAGKHEGWPFYVMAYVPGSTLSARIKNGALSIRDTARLAHQLADAMGYAHRQGVVHRDLKPANILLGDNDRPRITDFGLAKLSSSIRLTASGIVMGSLPYLAPEQALGRNGLIGPATDVYALGIIMYTMLAGKPPFNDEDPMQLLKRITTEVPAKITTLRPDVPPLLARIMDHCLAKAPQDRFASGNELAAALAAYLDGQQDFASPAGSSTSTSPATLPTCEQPAANPTGRGGTRFRGMPTSWIATALGAAVVAATAWIIWMVVK